MSSSQFIPDFSEMMFNIHEVPHGTDLCDHFPKLRMYKEFQGYSNADRNKVIRYIMYFYDKNSPYVRHIADYHERQERCLLEAGFKKTGREWPKKVQKYIDGKSADVNNMIQCFMIKLVNCYEYQVYTTFEKLFQDLIKTISQPIDEEDADPDKIERAYKLRIENKTGLIDLKNELNSLRQQMYPDYERVEAIIENKKEESVFKAGAPEAFAVN